MSADTEKSRKAEAPKATPEPSDDVDRVLGMLEPQKADASLPPGWKWGRLQDAGIMSFADHMPGRLKSGKSGRNVFADEITRSGSKPLMRRDALKLRWPILDPAHSEATNLWQAKAAKVAASQEAARLAAHGATQSDAEDGDGERSPTLKRGN